MDEKNYWLGAQDCIRALRWLNKSYEGRMNLFGTEYITEIIDDEDAETIVTRVQNEMNELSILNDIKVGDLVDIGHGVSIILIKIDSLGRRVSGFDKNGNYYTVPVEKVQYSHIHYDGIERFLGGDKE